MLNTAVSAGKRARSETSISKGTCTCDIYHIQAPKLVVVGVVGVCDCGRFVDISTTTHPALIDAI